MKEARRILLVRLSALGDAIVTMPMLSALRASFPKAFIAWVAEPGPAEIIRGHQALDELIVLRKGWLKSGSEIRSLRRRLRKLRIDIALDPQGLTKSSAVGWLSGAKRRIGFASPVGRELGPWLDNELLQARHSHVVDRQLELLKALGINSPRVQFSVPRDQQAEHWATDYLRTRGIPETFAVINPGAGWNSRVWPAERYGSVARRLGFLHGVPSLVIWAGEEERRMAETIAACSQGQAVPAPSTTLRELASLLRRASLYLGSDTGPTHLAAALGIRCVALYGPTRPEVSGPYGSQHIHIQAYYQDGSRRRRRTGPNTAMRAITVDQVAAACEFILRETSQREYRLRAA